MRLLPTLCFLLLLPTAYAQPAKWGEVSESDLALDAYPADPDAAAIVLSDVGAVTFGEGGKPELERHVRIKLLRESGYDLATVSIPYVHAGRAERLYRIQGQTFTALPSGDVRRTKLKKRDVFHEKMDGRRSRATFTLPDLAPGSVVEYRYTVESKSPMQVPSWTFTWPEPVRHSEFVAVVPEQLSYVRVVTGTVPVELVEAQSTYTLLGEGTRFRWVGQDLPALRPEPHMGALRDYETRLDLQFSGYEGEFGTQVDVLNTWERLARELDEHGSFGRALRTRGPVRSRGEAFASDGATPTRTVQAVYDFVSGSIEATSERGFFASDDLDDVLADGSGRHADVVLLFVALARSAGLDAQPVLISTREHGAALPSYPLLDQFDSVLARVRIGERTFWLDPTDPLRPFGMLPPEARVDLGWVPARKGHEWVGISSPVSTEKMVTFEGRLGSDGSLRGRAEALWTGYEALGVRRVLREGEVEGSVARSVLRDLPGMALDSVAVHVPEHLGAPVMSSFEVNVEAYAQPASGRLLLNPSLALAERDHPFTARERLSDVRYAFPKVDRTVATFRLPAGYEVEAVPEPLHIATPGRVLSWRRMVEESDGVVTVRVDAARLGTSLEKEHYGALREFYDLVLTAQEDVIVLRRTPEVAPSGASEGAGGLQPETP